MEQNMMLFDMQLSVIREGNLAIREENSVNDTTQEFRRDCEPRAISISRIQPIRGFIGYPIERCKELLLAMMPGPLIFPTVRKFLSYLYFHQFSVYN